MALAFAVAAVADGLSVFVTLAPPVQWTNDLVTAALLFVLFGWQWILVSGLIMEAIPGLYVFPFWVLVVAAVAVWGTARPAFLTANSCNGAQAAAAPAASHHRGD